MEPTVEKDEHGEIVRSGIYTYGETVHLFVERKNYTGTLCQVFRNGSQIINLSCWFEVYRSHGWKCWLGRNGYLGKMVRGRYGL